MEIKIESNKRILVWKSDDFTALKKEFGKKEAQRKIVLNKLKSIDAFAEINHSPNGAPLIKSDVFKEISISHSQEWFAIYLSKENESLGIDIQVYSSSISQGKHYFLHKDDEKKDLSDLELSLIWCGKEALYKKMKGKIQDLKNDVFFKELDFNTNQLELMYSGRMYRFNFKVENQFALVWTVE